MNQQALEAAAKAIAALGHTNPPSWGDYNPAEKSVLSAMARAALTAYAEATGERVVFTTYSECTLQVMGTGLNMLTRVQLNDGDSVVVRKAGT